MIDSVLKFRLQIHKPWNFWQLFVCWATNEDNCCATHSIRNMSMQSPGSLLEVKTTVMLEAELSVG